MCNLSEITCYVEACWKDRVWMLAVIYKAIGVRESPAGLQKPESGAGT